MRPPTVHTGAEFLGSVNLADLRRLIETAFARDGGGGTGGYGVKVCPVCGEDRAREAWHGLRDEPEAMCERCWREGYYPGERRVVNNSVNNFPPEIHTEEGTMPDMDKRPCVHGCGKRLDPRGAHKHEAVCEKAPKAPGGPHEYPAPPARRRQAAPKKPSKPSQVGPEADRPVTGVQRAAAALGKELGCDRCAGRCLQGANVPTVQFIERLIRDGLSLEAAGRAREAAVVFGGGR